LHHVQTMTSPCLKVTFILWWRHLFLISCPSFLDKWLEWPSNSIALNGFERCTSNTSFLLHLPTTTRFSPLFCTSISVEYQNTITEWPLEYKGNTILFFQKLDNLLYDLTYTFLICTGTQYDHLPCLFLVSKLSKATFYPSNHITSEVPKHYFWKHRFFGQLATSGMFIFFLEFFTKHAVEV